MGLSYWSTCLHCRFTRGEVAARLRASQEEPDALLYSPCDPQGRYTAQLRSEQRERSAAAELRPAKSSESGAFNAPLSELFISLCGKHQSAICKGERVFEASRLILPNLSRSHCAIFLVGPHGLERRQPLRRACRCPAVQGPRLLAAMRRQLGSLEGNGLSRSFIAGASS